MDPSCLVSTVQACGDVIIWGTFSCYTLSPLVLTEYLWNITAYPRIVAGHVHPFMATVCPFSHDCFQQDNAPCPRAQIILNWFDNQFAVLKCHRQSPDLKPAKHLWDAVEQEICIIDVQSTNLLQLCDANTSILPKISEENFQHLVESALKQFLKQKGNQHGTSWVNWSSVWWVHVPWISIIFGTTFMLHSRLLYILYFSFLHTTG